jgi:hypothetical protein
MMFVLFGILILVVGILIMALSGLSLDPFFLPLDVLLLVTLYLLIVMTGLNFFFRNMEITYNTSNSQKYLMTRNSQRSGVAIIIVCAFVALIVMFPATATTANKILSLEERDAISTTGESFARYFDNQDRLGLFKSEWVDVRLNVGQARVMLCEKADYQDDDLCDTPLFVRQQLDANDEIRIPVPEEGYVQLVLVITNLAGGSSSFAYRVERNPAEIFIGLQPLVICAVFIVMNAVWGVYLQPTKRKYSTTSVYSDDYVVPTAAESEIGAERAQAPEAPVFGPARPTIRRREVAEPPPLSEGDVLPPPPLPGRAHPLPKGAFLNDLLIILDSDF